MKTAIITGASVGIGQSAAQLFLDEGFEVYNLSRRPCPVAGVGNIPCDLASEASIEKACEQLAAAIEHSDSVALVHNACQMRKDSATDCDSASLRDNCIPPNWYEEFRDREQ